MSWTSSRSPNPSSTALSSKRAGPILKVWWWMTFGRSELRALATQEQPSSRRSRSVTPLRTKTFGNLGFPLPPACSGCLSLDLHSAARQNPLNASLDHLATHEGRMEDRLPSGHYRLRSLRAFWPAFCRIIKSSLKFSVGPIGPHGLELYVRKWLPPTLHCGMMKSKDRAMSSTT
jgi:hypothetical protein